MNWNPLSRAYRRGFTAGVKEGRRASGVVRIRNWATCRVTGSDFTRDVFALRHDSTDINANGRAITVIIEIDDRTANEAIR